MTEYEFDLYTTIVSYFRQTAEILIMSYCFYRFTASFMKNKKGALCSGAAYLFTLLILHLLPVFLPDFSFTRGIIRDYFFRGAAAALAGFLVMCRVEKRDYEHKIFLVVTYSSLVFLTFTMADVSYDNLGIFAEKIKHMQTHLTLDICFSLFVATSVISHLLHFIFMIIALRYIVKAYAGQSMEMSKKELLMLTVPSLACTAGQMIILNYRPSYVLWLWHEGVKWNTYDALIFLYCAVSFIAIVVVIVLYRSVRAGQEEKMQSELLGVQIDSVRRHIEQVENMYRDIRSIRHDMANHLFTLEKLYEENEIEEARAYSAQIKETLTEMAGEMKSGNPVTDVILQEVKEKAEKQGISFRSEFYYPADSKVNAFDISVILHNALQNALENVESSENAHIQIRSYQKKNAYIIEVSNSYSGVLQWNEQNGLPLTVKEKTDGQGYGQSHGYGLSNIRRIARKYCGDTDITLADGEFRLSVMLML